jgi:HAE1 family hydrophobic/amphiphilic exporter-1
VQIAIIPTASPRNGVGLNHWSAAQSANFSVSAGQITDDGRRLRVQPKGEAGRPAASRPRADQRAAAPRDIADVAPGRSAPNYVLQIEASRRGRRHLQSVREPG